VNVVNWCSYVILIAAVRCFSTRCSNIHSNFSESCHKYTEQFAINCKLFYVTIISTNIQNVDFSRFMKCN